MAQNFALVHSSSNADVPQDGEGGIIEVVDSNSKSISQSLLFDWVGKFAKTTLVQKAA